MYSNSHPARHPAQTLSLNSIPPPYADFTGYHHVPGVGDPLHTNPSTGVWNPAYAAEELAYGYGFTGSSPCTGQAGVTSPDLTGMPTAGGGSFTPYSFPPGQESPSSSRGKSLDWARHSVCPSGGKTRTKDKYRVVYSDHQRLELEKEFQYSRYITIRRKAELSLALSLSERQVKIWFQNRRAKERKLNRKKLQLSQQASTTTPTPVTSSPSSNILSNAISEEY
ncbi:homeobox protein CHOX-CAD [Myripristis murdjan]|uniref:homeobox protein CHOX-CAD n=1 Tax=Myripristis murdjan TaxID=586833 RepID=UPI0011763D40|nr:homeobox protein CDX-1 [Myripristis murdjan]